MIRNAAMIDKLKGVHRKKIIWSVPDGRIAVNSVEWDMDSGPDRQVMLAELQRPAQCSNRPSARHSVQPQRLLHTHAQRT